MAETRVLICDRCDKLAVGTMRIEWKGVKYDVDRCERHANEDLAPARRPKRGRKPTYANA